MRDASAAILYIGKANDLRKRVAHYFCSDVEPKIRALMAEVRHIDYITAAGERDALLIEQRLIKRHLPLYNVMWKDGKSYPFVVLTLNEDYPRLRLTRVLKRDGGLYFGPYPNVRAVRHLLDWVWRNRLFPLRPCDLDITEGKVYAYEKVKSCLYLHTGECPAPCLGRVTKADYGRIAERARLFFDGKNTELLEVWRAEMKEAADRMQFERAAQLRDSLSAVDHIQEPVTVRSLKEEEVKGRLESTRALQELQTALGLPRPPLRIECFDISHIQGTETVASMVCFDRGRPNKSAYRKYKIKTVAGVDDFASMAEVVGRRYRRVKEEGLPWPDLILIDGGAGQLSAAERALRGVTDRNISLASLAKREEEVYQSGREKPLRLPKNSPALQLLQRVRDEAHRFAVSFHRTRRDKLLFSSEKPIA
jgi:excinuclease ABC subunit C